jgi:hypothetical protein
MYIKKIIDTGPAFLGRGFSTLRRCQIQVNSSYKQMLKGQIYEITVYFTKWIR